MLTEIILEAWIALRRNYTRSLLTMLGIVWGIATVTLLIAYGSSFRRILVGGFDAFGKSVVICWPQQTSEQPGGQRAGKKVRAGAGGPRHGQGDGSAGETRLPGNRASPRHQLRRPHGGNGAGPRRLPGVWRDAQRSPVRRALDLLPETNWSAAAWSSSADACASSCSAGGRRSARRCRSAACTSP